MVQGLSTSQAAPGPAGWRRRDTHAEIQRTAVRLGLVIGLTAGLVSAARAQSVEELRNLSIEDLANINVSSVLRTKEPLSDAPAAVYVITHDDIIRSGATGIPEMLRLAPNLQVAQINASSYAISARGFNGFAANKLLVMIDGRSVYSPYFQGVFWDVQDVLPEDVERIEVISGPGATLWGANAVNGVINIITKNSADTQGGVADLGGGNLERRGAARYGGRFSPAATYRIYGEGFDHSSSRSAAGGTARDAWHKSQGGFRVDWRPGHDLVTFEGNAYHGSEEQLLTANQQIYGDNLRARWNHPFDGGSSLQVQVYYDSTSRFVAGGGGDRLDVYDIDIQHSFTLGSRQAIVWGGGYRISNDHFANLLTGNPVLFFDPANRSLRLGNVFVQDTISLSDALKLILGVKLEDDPYVGLNVLPSVRASWKVTDNDLLWAAVSRAVRAPSREDRDFFERVSGISLFAGDDFQSEKLTAYELGYRAQPTRRLSFSVNTYYNVYDDLRSGELSPGGTLPAVFGNKMEGDTYGIEAWGSYSVTDWWRLSPGVSWLHKNLRLKPDSSGLTGTELAGDDPSYQVLLRSSMNLPHDTTLDIDLRRVGALPNPAVPAYTEADVRIGWNVTRSLEISLTGANLLHAHHQEFIFLPSNDEVGRSFFLNLRAGF